MIRPTNMPAHQAVGIQHTPSKTRKRTSKEGDYGFMNASDSADFEVITRVEGKDEQQQDQQQSSTAPQLLDFPNTKKISPRSLAECANSRV
jgi:hypothetical protein